MGHCTCQPEVLQPCLECYDLRVPNPDCWACHGRGLVPKYDEDAAVVVVHDERCRYGDEEKEMK